MLHMLYLKYLEGLQTKTNLQLNLRNFLVVVDIQVAIYVLVVVVVIFELIIIIWIM